MKQEAGSMKQETRGKGPMNYQECLKEIDDLQGRGIHRDLDRIEKACRLLGNPQDHFPSIHIAGSNGKGSTAAITAEILKRAHYKTGLTISPHVEDFRERIQINGQWISEEEVMRIHQSLKRRVGHISLTYFEWVILMAFLYFAESRVDMAVVETGMGGRWDATNMLRPLIGVITNISLEHEDYLGGKTENILEEKMQILKPGMVAWTGIKEKFLLLILNRHCKSQGISLYQLSGYFRDNEDETFSIFDYRGVKCGLAGRHQKENAGLAVAVCLSLIEKGYRISRTAIEDGVLNVFWPCRLETVAASPALLLDAAHNRAGIAVLASYLKMVGRKYHLVFGTLKNRPFEEMISALLPYALSIHWASFNEPRAPTFSELEEKLKGLKLAKKYGDNILKIESSPWQEFYSSIPANEAVLVTGSLYLTSQVRALVRAKNKK